MNKKYLWLLTVPMLLLSCAGNGESSNNNVIDDSNALIKENTTIEFLCLTDSHYKSELERMIKEFKTIEPHVTVNLTNPPAAGSYVVLEKMVVAGFFQEDYPDIVQCYPDNVVKYIDRGYALNFDKYLNNETYGLKEEKSDYIDSFMDEGANYSVEGTYSLPFCKSTELLYYNADVLIGLDLSGINASINEGKALDFNYLNNLTWDELFNNLCPAIKAYNDAQDASHKIYDDVADEHGNPGIFTYDSDENFFITLAMQNNYGYTSFNKEIGKGQIDFNNEGMRNLMKTMNSATKNGYLQTKGSNGDYVSELFIRRKALFTISSTAGLSYNIVSDYDVKENGLTKFEVGVARIPHAEGHEYSSINQGPSICLLDHKDDNRALASYLFWKHITNKDNSLSWAVNTGYMGIRHSNYESDAYKEALAIIDKDDIYSIAVSENLNMISQVSAYTFNTAVFKGSSNARANAGKLMTACLKDDDIENNVATLFTQFSEDAESYLG